MLVGKLDVGIYFGNLGVVVGRIVFDSGVAVCGWGSCWDLWGGYGGILYVVFSLGWLCLVLWVRVFFCVWLRMGGGWLLEDSFGLGFGVFCGVCFLRFGFCGLGVETVGVL